MTDPRLKVYDSVLETIGWTPLIRLSRLGAGIRTPNRESTLQLDPGSIRKAFP